MNVATNDDDFRARLSAEALKEQEEIIALYDRAMRQEVEWNDYVVVLLKKMENYIKSRIGKFHSTRKTGVEGDFEDLMQNGYTAILAHAGDYDPRRARPTTFFTPYIDEVIKPSVNGGLKASYGKHLPKLERAARELGKDICDEDLELDLLKEMTGIPLLTIKRVVEFKRTGMVSFADVDENTASHQTPEQAVIEAEQKRFVWDSVAKLSGFKRFLIRTMYDTADGKEMSNLKIIQMYNSNPAFRAKFKEPLPATLTMNTVQRMKNEAIRELRAMPELKSYGSTATMVYEEIDQATESDIFDAFKDDDDDNEK